MKLAYEECKAKFPEADVELEDFRLVGGKVHIICNKIIEISLEDFRLVGGKASAFSRRF